MSDILDDFEDFWYNVDRRWEQEDDLLSRLEDFNCPCPVCNISDDEKIWASKQVDLWISKFA